VERPDVRDRDLRVGGTLGLRDALPGRARVIVVGGAESLIKGNLGRKLAEHDVTVGWHVAGTIRGIDRRRAALRRLAGQEAPQRAKAPQRASGGQEAPQRASGGQEAPQRASGDDRAATGDPVNSSRRRVSEIAARPSVEAYAQPGPLVERLLVDQVLEAGPMRPRPPPRATAATLRRDAVRNFEDRGRHGGGLALAA